MGNYRDCRFLFVCFFDGKRNICENIYNNCTFEHIARKFEETKAHTQSHDRHMVYLDQSELG